MNNNDILSRLCSTFNLSEAKMAEIFAQGGLQTSQEQIRAWLQKNNDPAFQKCSDPELAIFLNGFINDRRGKKEGAQPVPEQRLTNNIVFTKLKIALNLQAQDIVDMMSLAGGPLSKKELGVFFRKPGHKHYRVCKDETLLVFFKALQLQYSREQPGEARPQ